MNSDLIVQVGTAVIALCGAVVTYILIPYAKARLTDQQQKNIAFWVQVAVAAAEQLFSKPGMGEEKKKYVLKFLNDNGINLTNKELNALIEAAVYEINRLPSKSRKEGE